MADTANRDVGGAARARGHTRLRAGPLLQERGNAVAVRAGPGNRGRQVRALAGG